MVFSADRRFWDSANRGFFGYRRFGFGFSPFLGVAVFDVFVLVIILR